MFTGRKKPYTETGIKRIKCSRCGRPANAQWQICANGNRYAGICDYCDIELNRMVLVFMRIPNRDKLIDKYKEEKYQ